MRVFNTQSADFTSLVNTATDSQAGATLTWSATGLPGGLTISASTGTVAGTPTTAGVFAVTITATDGSGPAGSASFTWTITNPVVTNTVSVTNPGGQSDLTGSAIAALVNTATNTQAGATLTWSATGLPAGLAVDAVTGAIAGTPTTAGSYAVTITATDASGAAGPASFTWTITNPTGTTTVSVTNPGNQSSVLGTGIAALVNTATDTQAGATFTWSASGLPGGLTIDASSGTITGIPTTAGVSSVTLTATASGAAGPASFTWTITSAPVLTPISGFAPVVALPNTITVANPGDLSGPAGPAIAALADRATDSAAGQALTWLAAGLPTGLSIVTADGTITGSPTTAGEFSVTLTAADGTGATGSASFIWTITSPVTVANPGARSNGLGAAIAPLANTATGSQAGASFTWSATGLPAGLSIASSAGTITGTPSAAGTYSVSLSATDSSGFTGTASFTWTITSASLSITPRSLASPAVGAAYAMTLAAVGGTAPYSWSVSTGPLPAGLALDATTGVISGTPSAVGPSTFSLSATDGAGQRATQSYTVTVLVASSATKPAAHAGIMASVPSGNGYWVASSNGTVLAFGSASSTGRRPRRTWLSLSWA